MATNKAKLSTGVEVRFQPIETNDVQDLILASFSGMNLQDMSENDVLQNGDKLVRYNTTLIQEGVFLVGNLNDAVAKLKLNNNWMKQLLRSGKVLDKELYDLTDERDREILFLRYYAFKTEADFQLLTTTLLNNQAEPSSDE